MSSFENTQARSLAGANLLRFAWRIAMFTGGLFLFAIGLVLNVRANLGLGPGTSFSTL